MQFKAAIANALWMASNLPAHGHFVRSLHEPQAAQRRKLRVLLRANANTAFGRAHQFETIASYEEFARRVPLSDYAAIEPWVARIRKGENKVLTCEAVTHLVPTSGSTAGRKLIPFTRGLQQEFDKAIGAWTTNLTRQFPGLLGGQAYWSITPVLSAEDKEESAVPIGFDSDTAYLAGTRRRFADAIMAVPANAGRARSLEAFRHRTLLHLLLCRELRLISVWHPSFLTLLLDALPVSWELLLADIEHGTDSIRANRQRARELRATDALRPETLWPELRVISCWGDAAASLPMRELQKRFANVPFQAKGLIATEAIVTIPFDGKYPVAIDSHFFEFIDQDGKVCEVEALRVQEEYEVVVTTAGGLWRYRLGDIVRVIGCVGKTPSLQFLGRAGNISDRFGEKLSEVFVEDAVRKVLADEMPRFVMVAPDTDEHGCRYTLYIEGEAQIQWARALDSVLRQNPNYAYCRDLGQLLPTRLFVIKGGAYEAFANRLTSRRAKLGDIKPATFNSTSGWSHIFSGEYYSADG
jgi:GH3 auxin-responsive promoter